VALPTRCCRTIPTQLRRTITKQTCRQQHANAVVTMMVYAHVDKLVDRGLLTTDELGLAGRWQLEDD